MHSYDDFRKLLRSDFQNVTEFSIANNGPQTLRKVLCICVTNILDLFWVIENLKKGKETHNHCVLEGGCFEYKICAHKRNFYMLCFRRFKSWRKNCFKDYQF